MAILRIMLTGAALLITAWAQQGVAFTEWPQSVTDGQSSTLKWTGSNGPVTITLQKGPSNNLQDVQVLTNNAQNGEYQWTPSADLANGSDYAFKISQNGQVNYSGQFQLSGGSSAGSSGLTNAPAQTQTPESWTTSHETQTTQGSSQATSTTRTNALLGTSPTRPLGTAGRTPSAIPSTSMGQHVTRSAGHREAMKTSEPNVSATQTSFVATKQTTTKIANAVHSGFANHLTGSIFLGAGAGFFAFFL